MGEGLEVAYARPMASLPARRPAPFIKNVLVVPERIERPDEYPFTIPAVKALDGLTLGAVTYFVGENGSGKSTILEAIAVAAGFNAEGGTANFRFATRRSESPLHRCLRLARIAKPKAGFFLRAESFFVDGCVFRTIAIGQNGASRSPKTGDADHPKRASRSRHEVTVSWGLQPMASTTAAWRPRDFRCTVYERF